MVVFNDRVFSADEIERGGPTANECIAGDGEALDGRHTVLSLGVVSMGVDGRALRYWVHIGECAFGDGNVAGDTSDEAHAGIERYVAAHASEGATAHSARPRHDEQTLEVVFP